MSTTSTPTHLPQSPSQVRTRFLIISDTHSASPTQNFANQDVAFRPPLPRADVLLHCGDLTMVGLLQEYETTIDMLEDIDAELKLVIAGNHDISLDGEYYARKGSYMHRRDQYDAEMPKKARELWTGERALKAGVTYLDEGMHMFTLSNGGKLRVYASPYQPEFCDWAFPYFSNQDRFNPPHQCTPNAVPIAENPVPDFPAVDVMMTHGPPKEILDATNRGEHVGCEHLLRAARRCRPRLHCFGHIHEGWGAMRVIWKEGDVLNGDGGEKLIKETQEVVVDRKQMAEERAARVEVGGIFGEETLMVNASIMTLSYRPWNGPWLIDMDLEKVKEP